MQKFLPKYYWIISIGLIIGLSSCSVSQSSARLYDPNEVTQLSKKLGIELSNRDKDDDKNIPLYLESSLWLGTPYKYAGNSKSGTDCSGFTQQVYQKTYRKKLERSTDRLANSRQKKVSKKNLKAGDLVYFATSNNKKKITHVGIYLKDKKFIHASTSRGVIVSHLDEDYYKKRWKKGGRP